MDELRIVTKKEKVIKPVTALVKVEHLAKDTFNPRVFYCKLFSTLQGHQSDVLSLTVNDDRIISGSQDKTIKIWDINSGELLHTLSGHNSGIYSLAISNNRLVSCSADRTIKIWDLNSFNLVCTLLGHNNHVYSISAGQNKFASASLDKTIKIWDIETKKLLKIIQTGESSALSICIKNEKLVAGLSDGTLKIWDLNSGSLLVSYQENDESITSVCVSNGLIISGSKDKTIRIWNLETLDLINTLSGHKGPVWTISVDDGKIISGSDDKTIKIWNLEDGALIDTLKGHSDWISSITPSHGRIISASGDSTIKIWAKIPLHNCNTIDFLNYETEKSPFETDKEFEQKNFKNLQKFYNKLISYDYINIGKAELLADEYSIDKQNLPVKININCDKVIKFSKLSKNSISNLTIDNYMAEQIYKNSKFQDLYIRYYLDNQVLKYEISIIFGNLKYIFGPKLQAIDNKMQKKTALKTDRLKITKGRNEHPKEFLNEQPRNDCNTIDTTDTFKSPFEANEDFEKRIRKKLINYDHINIGKVELLAEQYNIEQQTFPLKIIVTCDKILNISDLEQELTANIFIERYKAKEIYEKSKIHNLFINFYEQDSSFFYNLSIIFDGTKYLIKN